MANYFISGCGTPDQAAGTFVVPVGTTIYFFSPPDSLLESRYSDFFMGQLCTDLISPTAEAYVRALSIEVAPEGELVPNHVATGSAFAVDAPSGIYRVGQPASNGPVIRLLDGVSRTLKDLVSGISDGGSIGAHVYWGVSRRDGNGFVGRSPRQYFGMAAARAPRASRFHGVAADPSPLGSAAFILERFADRSDYIDFPNFREFKAKLRSGDGAHRRARAGAAAVPPLT
jgi:hypothetical protein